MTYKTYLTLFKDPIAFLESVGRIDYKTGLAYNNQSMVIK